MLSLVLDLLSYLFGELQHYQVSHLKLKWSLALIHMLLHPPSNLGEAMPRFFNHLMLVVGEMICDRARPFLACNVT